MRKIIEKNKLMIKRPNNTKDVSSLDSIIESIVDLLEGLKRKKTLEEVLDIYEKNIDSFIIKTCKSERLNYISGYLTVIPTSEIINIEIECYFQDARKRWIKKEANSVIERENIADTVIECVETKYEIESPLAKMGGK